MAKFSALSATGVNCIVSTNKLLLAKHLVWQPQSDLRKVNEERHKGNHRKCKGQHTNVNIGDVAARESNILRNKKVQTHWWCDQGKLHHHDHEDSKPQWVEAERYDEWHDDAHCRHHHGDSF